MAVVTYLASCYIRNHRWSIWVQLVRLRGLLNWQSLCSDTELPISIGVHEYHVEHALLESPRLDTFKSSLRHEPHNYCQEIQFKWQMLITTTFRR